jgi:hypothetical protein
VLALCIVLTSVSIVFAASWQKCASDSKAEHYFDTESAGYVTPIDAPDRRFIEVWVRSIYKSEQNDGARSMIAKLWLNLENKQIAIKSFHRFDINGVTIKSEHQKGTWLDCIPGSSGELIYDKVRRYVEQKHL